jgi:hypothetical protein
MLDANTDKLLQTDNNIWQTRPVVRALHRDKTATFRKQPSDRKRARYLDIVTDWLTDRQL